MGKCLSLGAVVPRGCRSRIGALSRLYKDFGTIHTSLTIYAYYPKFNSIYAITGLYNSTHTCTLVYGPGIKGFC